LIGFAFALSLFGGMAVVLLRTACLISLPADLRAHGATLLKPASYLFGGLLAVGLYWLQQEGVLSSREQLTVLAVLIGVGTAGLWCSYYHPALEQILEMLIWPVFRIRAYGPGVSQMPEHGPLVVIANHTAWFDPIWLGKVIPRKITPMMTSRFYDIPVLRWIMAHVVHAIRVQISRYRREVPELGEAIAALDRGECVVVFPEGFMRRREDRPLRRFGQGVWHILSKRPATPVVVCWIEGGWGSYFSYAGGPPTKNKRFDFWRRIQVAMEAPQTLDPALLKDQRATRTYLMRVCLEARRHLGLQPLAHVEAIAADEPEDEGDQE
jgi:1-acyl-sn-glycerol-3-phosphate acyltransferase